MERYLMHLIKGAEIRTQQFLDHQEKNPADVQYGGLRGDIWEAKPTIYALTAAVAVYLNPASRFYQDESLYQAMDLALDFVRRTQREDGSFDYPSCNFKSAADTSFCFKRLIAAYRLLKKYGGDDSKKLCRLQEKYRFLMRRALSAICGGGFHTPNHRWGITAALLQGANLFAEETEFAEKLRERAGQYLAEGIDGDEDGEYAERSTGNYNAVVNNAMMALYQETGDDRFLGYVRRNLEMMLLYIDPDDTVFTQNSSRQDKGRADHPDKYFYQYLYLCSREDQPRFDAAAHKIIKDNMERGDLAPDCLHIVMNHDEMLHHTFTYYGYLDSYRKFFRHPGVLRVKNERYTYTVLKGKSEFLFFQSGDMCVYVKIGSSYCSIRNFVPQTIQAEDGVCTLKAEADGWYYQPFQDAPDTSDWWEMDHTRREILVSSKLYVTVQIRELEQGLEITVKTDGIDRLPLRLETCIPAGTVIENDQFHLKAEAGSSMILRAGMVRFHKGGQVMSFGPGFGTHEFQGHYSGEEQNTAGFTLYCNEYTPLEKTFRLCVEKNG